MKIKNGDLPSVLHSQRLNVPDAISILVSDTVHGEKAHASNAGDGLGQPLLLVLEGLVHHVVRGDVRVEVIGNKVVVSMFFNGRRQCRKVSLVAKHAGLDRLEDFLQLWIQLEVAVQVPMAEFLHIFGEVAE